MDAHRDSLCFFPGTLPQEVSPSLSVFGIPYTVGTDLVPWLRVHVNVFCSHILTAWAASVWIQIEPDGKTVKGLPENSL